MAPQGLLDVIAIHIEQNPEIRSGKPHIRGTRVTVADIVLWTENGMSPDEVAIEFPQLTLADIHAALAYYHDNQELVDRQIRDSCEFASRMRDNLLGVSAGEDVKDDGNQVSP